MNTEPFAYLYAALAALPVAMHLCLVAGARLGRYTMGGFFPGRLPLRLRALALLQAGLLCAMAWTVLAHGTLLGAVPPRWTLWAVIVVTGFSLAANAASPSPPERRLWTPVLALMTLAALAVALI